MSPKRHKIMRVVPSVIIAFLVSTLAGAADTKLFSMSRSSRAETPGILYNYSMTFTEIERAATTSIVEIVYTPPRYSDETDLLAGVCGLLHARGEKFALGTLRTVSKEPLRQEVTFLKSAPQTDAEQLSVGIVSLSSCQRFFTN
jgi:hypothetical protein